MDVVEGVEEHGADAAQSEREGEEKESSSSTAAAALLCLGARMSGGASRRNGGGCSMLLPTVSILVRLKSSSVFSDFFVKVGRWRTRDDELMDPEMRWRSRRTHKRIENECRKKTTERNKNKIK